MKKTVVLFAAALIFLSFLSASDYSYSGSGTGSDGASISLPLSVSPDDLGSFSYVNFGFYTSEGNADGKTDPTTLVFEESQPTGGDTTSRFSYTASAAFRIFVYVLSNQSGYVTLSWEDLSPQEKSDGMPSSIAFSVTEAGQTEKIANGTKSNKGNILKFGPSYYRDSSGKKVAGSPVFQVVDKSYAAETEQYEVDRDEYSGTKTYTGKMYLTLEITS